MTKELKRFEQWWDAEDDIPNDGPYTPDTPIQFAWAGWQAALAQPEQKPVTWAVYEADGTHHNKPCQYPKCSYPCPDLPDCRDAQPEQEPVAIALNTGTKQGVKWLKNVEHGESLYTSPPPQRTWVGLIRGVRVEGDTVVITVKGGNDAARELCSELLNEMGVRNGD